MSSSEEMLDALFSKARVINPGYMSRPILRTTGTESDSEDSKVVDLETVWSELGLGKGEKHGLVEQADWYSSFDEKILAAKKEKKAVKWATAATAADAPLKHDDKGKEELDERLGGGLLDAIQYENNRLNSVNRMIGGSYNY